MESSDVAFDQASGNLVGFQFQSDVPTACPAGGDAGAFTLVVGRMPDASCGAPTSDFPCAADAGAE
jgi:hypothetical protein